VAEQGQKNDADHQEPMFHSIIPNPLAMDYDNRMKKKMQIYYFKSYLFYQHGR
jgi:hypothetical protein